MADIVFAGPSLPAAEVTALLPGAVVLPPVAHGDLLRLDAGAGDRVLIIDGYFLQHAPVRHREILELLDRGVTVAGAASMGALRAAELWQFGMRGIGEVFRLYRDGVVTGDDEVAVMHGEAEDGFRTLSEPLVNIRIALGRAVVAGVLTGAEAGTLLQRCRELPFRRRSYRALERTAGPDAEPVARFLTWHRLHPYDAKTADARLLLTLAARGSADLVPARPDDQPIEHLHTRYLDTWHTRHAGVQIDGRWVADREAAAVLLLLHPDAPAWQRRTVLAGVAQTGAGGNAEPDADDIEWHALAAAADHGLHGDGGPEGPGPGWEWLTGAERALDRDEATLRVLVRAFGTTVHRSVALWMVPEPLRTPRLLAAARQIAATAAALNETLIPASAQRQRPGARLHFRTEVVDDAFAALWRCPVDDLTPAVWDRGMRDLTSFRLAAEPLVAYLKTFGAPQFPAVRAEEHS